MVSGAIQEKKQRPPLHLSEVAIEKQTFESPSTKNNNICFTAVASSTFYAKLSHLHLSFFYYLNIYIYIYIYILGESKIWEYFGNVKFNLRTSDIFAEVEKMTKYTLLWCPIHMVLCHI